MFRYLIAILLAAAPVPVAEAQETPGTKVDASQGGVTVSSGANSLTIGARVQFRWTLDAREAFDADTAGTGLGRADGASSAFDIPRLRLMLGGGVYRPWLRYSFQAELGRTGGEGGSRIKDAILEIRPVGSNHRVVLGQFKVPFGLQQSISSGRLQLVDRAITDARFNPARDLGAMVSGTALGRRLGYDLGVFNGAGESVRQNTTSHLWAARVYVDPLGPFSLSEGSIDGAASPALHLGAGVRGGKQARGRTTAGIEQDADNQTAFNVELAYRRPRLYSTAEYFWMRDEQENPAARPDLVSRGYHVQGGYMAVPQRLELALLWSAIGGDTRVDDAQVSELRGGATYYFVGHDLKLQADLGRLAYGENFAALSSRARQGLPALGPRLVTGRSLTDTQVRVQLQLGF